MALRWPPRSSHGFADRRGIAVVTDPIDGATAELLALAEHWGADVTLEVWGAEAALASPDERVERLRDALVRPGVDVHPLPVDFSATEVLVDVAGPVVAWPEPTAPPSGNGQGADR